MISGIWMYIAIYCYWKTVFCEIHYNEARMVNYMVDGMGMLHIGFIIALFQHSEHNCVLYMVAILLMLLMDAWTFHELVISRRR